MSSAKETKSSTKSAASKAKKSVNWTPATPGPSSPDRDEDVPKSSKPTVPDYTDSELESEFAENPVAIRMKAHHADKYELKARQAKHRIQKTRNSKVLPKAGLKRSILAIIATDDHFKEASAKTPNKKLKISKRFLDTLSKDVLLFLTTVVKSSLFVTSVRKCMTLNLKDIALGVFLSDDICRWTNIKKSELTSILNNVGPKPQSKKA